MSDEKHPHLLALTAALTSEEAWQREEHARLLRLPLDERVAVGVSWAPLRVEAVEEAGRGRVVVRLRSPVPLHDGIASGDLVTLAPEGSPDAGLEGTSLGAEGKIAEVLVDGPFDDARNQAVTKRFDATTFHRMRGALSRAFTSPNALGDVLLGRRAPSEPPGWKPGATGLAGPPRGPGLPARAKLNQPQLEAAVHALSAAEIALIHGPPAPARRRSSRPSCAASPTAGTSPGRWPTATPPSTTSRSAPPAPAWRWCAWAIRHAWAPTPPR